MVQLSKKESEVLLYLLRSIREEEISILFDGQDRKAVVNAIEKECRNLEETY